MPQAIGLTALDLVSGLFGMLVVLYALTSPVDGERGVADTTRQHVRLQVDGTYSVRAGLEIGLGEQTFRSWSDCARGGGIRWTTCDAGLVEATIESNEPIKSLKFMLLELPPVDEVEVWIRAPGLSAICMLTLEYGFRSSSDDPTCVQVRQP